jgi:hypothetical protein
MAGSSPDFVAWSVAIAASLVKEFSLRSVIGYNLVYEQ